MPTARQSLSRAAALLGLMAILLRLLAPALHTCDHAHALTTFGADSHVGCSHGPWAHAHDGDAAEPAQDDAGGDNEGRPAHRSANREAHDACAVCTMFASSEGASVADRGPPLFCQLAARADIRPIDAHHASEPRSTVQARAPPVRTSACRMPRA